MRSDNHFSSCRQDLMLCGGSDAAILPIGKGTAKRDASQSIHPSKVIEIYLRNSNHLLLFLRLFRNPNGQRSEARSPLNQETLHNR